MSTSSSLSNAASVQTGVVPLALAALLGLFIIGFAGFSHTEVVHNAGHDYRHSMAFPCH
jgi:cobalt transporter subunit CbtB